MSYLPGCPQVPLKGLYEGPICGNMGSIEGFFGVVKFLARQFLGCVYPNKCKERTTPPKTDTQNAGANLGAKHFGT